MKLNFIILLVILFILIIIRLYFKDKYFWFARFCGIGESLLGCALSQDFLRQWYHPSIYDLHKVRHVIEIPGMDFVIEFVPTSKIVWCIFFVALLFILWSVYLFFVNVIAIYRRFFK